MSKDIAKLVVKLEAQTKKYDEKLAKANKTIKRFHAQQRKSLKGIAGDFKTILGGVAVGAATASFARSVIETTNRIEQLKLQLETVTGSAENAEKAFNMIEDFASQTPFQVEQLTDAFIKLQSLGLEPSAKALESYGNTASAMGKSLNQMIEAVADASTGEFERLKEFGIKAKSQGDDVTFIFQGVSTKIGKNAEEITEYLQDLGNVQFAGAMERQANSLTGAWSNLQDKITKALTVEGPALTNLTNQLKGLENVIASENFQTGVQNIATAMVNLAASSAEIVSHWGKGSEAQEAIRGISKAIRELRDIQEGGAFETLLGMETSRPKAIGEMTGQRINAIESLIGFASIDDLRGSLAEIDQVIDQAFADMFSGDDVQKNHGLLIMLESVRDSMVDQIQLLQKRNEVLQESAEIVQQDPVAILADPSREEAIQAVVDGLAEYNAELVELADKWSVAYDKEEKFKRGLQELNAVMATGALDAKIFTARFEELKQELDGLPDKTDDATDKMSVFADEAARNMQSAFADFLFDPFEDGLDGMLKGFIDILRRMAAEQLAANIFGSLPSLFGSPTPGGAPVVDGVPTMNGGGFTGNAPRVGGVDGLGGFMAVLHPNETVIDHTVKGSATAGNQITIAPQFSLSAIDSRGMGEVIAEQQGAIISVIDQYLNEKGVAAL
jgi:hypothetical protein